MIQVQKKVRKKKAKPVDTATPVIRKPKSTDVARINVTRSLTSTMKDVPVWNATPALQAATAAWNTVADAVESNAKTLAALRVQVATLEAVQRTHRRDWSVAMKHVISNVEIAADGSADVVQTLGFDVRTCIAATAQAAPSGFVSLPATASGEAGVAWQRGTARHGFVVQHCTDPANPASFSAGIPSTKTKFAITGAQSASIVHFRVAAIDPKSSTGVSPWSDWVACTVA